MESLSIIVPVRNAASYLPAALASLADAACGCTQSVEVVVVDDGSTDGSAAAAEAFSAGQAVRAFDSFRILSLPGKGVSAARNAGLAAASGEWIGFMDADDLVSPGWLASANAAACAAPDADVVNLLPPVHFKDPAKFVRATAKARLRGLRISRGAAARERLFKTYLRDGWCWANFLRRDRLAGVRFPDGMRFKEDMVFLLDAAHGAECAVAGTFPGYGHRLHGSAASETVADGDSVRFLHEMSRISERGAFPDAAKRAAGRTLAGDFVRWTFSKSPEDYDAEKCPVLEGWRAAAAAGLFDVNDMPWRWRRTVRAWLESGDIRPAWRMRRLRYFWKGEWICTT